MINTGAEADEDCKSVEEGTLPEVEETGDRAEGAGNRGEGIAVEHAFAVVGAFDAEGASAAQDDGEVEASDPGTAAAAEEEEQR